MKVEDHDRCSDFSVRNLFKHLLDELLLLNPAARCIKDDQHAWISLKLRFVSLPEWNTCCGSQIVELDDASCHSAV
jgi:hypothetical protein